MEFITTVFYIIVIIWGLAALPKAIEEIKEMLNKK